MGAGWTQADLDSLRSAMRRGVRKVKYADREEEYRSLREMKALEREAEEELGQRSKGPNRRIAMGDKGLGRGAESYYPYGPDWY